MEVEWYSLWVSLFRAHKHIKAVEKGHKKVKKCVSSQRDLIT